MYKLVVYRFFKRFSVKVMDTTKRNEIKIISNGISKKKTLFYYNTSLLLTELDAHALT